MAITQEKYRERNCLILTTNKGLKCAWFFQIAPNRKGQSYTPYSKMAAKKICLNFTSKCLSFIHAAEAERAN